MLFAGSSFFLSPKLPIPETRTLRELINSNGGKLCSNASNRKTLIVLDSWDPETMVNDISKGESVPFVGPSYIKYCVENQVKFDASHAPILCMALKGLVVCFTGAIPEWQKQMKYQIQWCGGSVQSEMDENVSVLVVGHASSRKLDIARELSIPLVSLEWAQKCFVSKTLVEYSLYPVKPLKGATIALTNFRSQQRGHVTDLLTSLGANFVLNLQNNPAPSHLVVNAQNLPTHPTSKYYFAKAHSIAVMPISWLEECQRQNRWVPEEEYELGHPETDPVPKENRTSRQKDARTPNKHFDYRPNSISASSLNAPLTTANGGSSSKPSIGASIPTHTYLQGFTVFLCCATPVQSDFYGPLVMNASGKLTYNPTEATFIVVCLDSGTALIPSAVAAQLAKIQPQNQPPLLAHPWLDACAKASQFVSTAPYVVDMDPNNRLIQWKTPAPRPAETAPAQHKTTEHVITPGKKRTHADINNLLQDIDAQDLLDTHHPPKARKLSYGVEESKPEAMDHDLPLLHGCAFISVSIESSKLDDLITRHGGQVFRWPVSASFQPEQFKSVYFITHHGIYSIFRHFGLTSLDFLAQYGAKIVTIQWLEYITNVKQIVCPSVFPLLFTPLPFAVSRYAETMQSVSICISSISESETYLLKLLARLMGCDSAGEALYPRRTTHVISLKSEGKKQSMAIDLGIQLVTPEWLYYCAKVGGKVDEQAFKLRPDVISTQAPRITSKPVTSALMAPPPRIPDPSSLEDDFEKVDFFAKPAPVVVGFSAPQSTEATEEFRKKPPTILPYELILHGVTIYIGKTLQSQQEELTQLAVAMGAEPSWTLDLNVTHYINQGKPEVPATSLKMSKGAKIPAVPELKPHYVSPQWLRKCSEEGQRVLEALYPASMDPRITLGIVAGSASTATSSSMLLSDHEPKRLGLTILNENGVSSSQASRQSSLTKSSSAAAAHTKKMISSVTIPKTRVESEFDEFENIDARYSNRRSAPEPPASSITQSHTETRAESPVPEAVAPVEEDDKDYTNNIPSDLPPSLHQTSLDPPTSIVEKPVELPTQAPEPVVVASEPERMDVVEESLPVVLSTVPTTPIPVVEAVFGESTEPEEHEEPMPAAAAPEPMMDITPTVAPAVVTVEVPATAPAAEPEPLNRTLNTSMLDSQMEGAVTQSQLVDSKTFEETMAQTELMRKLLASLPNQKPTHRSIFLKSAVSKPADESLNGPTQVPFTPISRSALLEFGSSSAMNTATTNGDALNSSGSDRSGHSSSTDLNEDDVSSSPPIPLDYLQATDVDDSHAPRVSYASMEPSEAVKSKLLGRAQLHLDSSTFQVNAAAEIRKLELMVSTPMIPAEKPDSATRTSSNASIRSDSRVSTPVPVADPVIPPLARSRTPSNPIIATDDHEEDDAHLGRLLPDPSTSKKFAFGASTAESRRPKDEPEVSPTNGNIFAKPKRKSDAHGASSAHSAANASSTTTTASVADPASPRFSKTTAASSSTSAKKSSKSAATETVEIDETEMARNKSIRVYLSGFDTGQSDKDEKDKLKSYALKLGMVVCAPTDFNWTHFVAKVYRNTDKSIISLACGRWILDVRWLEDSFLAKNRLGEEKYEYRGSLTGAKQLADPRKCRRAIAKLGRSFFQDMNILYYSKQTVWMTVLINSGAKVDRFKPDPAKPMSISTIMKYNLVYTTPSDWAMLPSATQALLDKSSVVVCDYFVEYLRTAIEPEKETWHPNFQRG